MAVLQLNSLTVFKLPNLSYAVYFSRYIGDWILSIGLIAAAAYLQIFSEPFHRHFAIGDPSINFPFAIRQQFDDARLFYYCIIIPLAVFTSVHLVRFVQNFQNVTKNNNNNNNTGNGNTNDAKRRLILTTLHNYHILILSFMIGLSLNGFITEFLKNLISKPRPDFIARCGVNYELLQARKVNYDSSICTKPLGEALFKDGFKSSPSGHSSFAFTGLGYLALWLAGQLKILVQSTKFRPFYLRVIPVVPILIACKIAISRTQDYRHHFKDILLGSALGIVITWFNYFWFFNRLDHKTSDMLILNDDYMSLGWTQKQNDQDDREQQPLEEHELNDMV